MLRQIHGLAKCFDESARRLLRFLGYRVLLSFIDGRRRLMFLPIVLVTLARRVLFRDQVSLRFRPTNDAHTVRRRARVSAHWLLFPFVFKILSRTVVDIAVINMRFLLLNRTRT